jgi:hypothetical protein
VIPATPMATLPFSEFLDALRDKGYGIGLHEYVALGKLLERWDSTDPEEIRNGLAALIARDEHEVREICEAFDKRYLRPDTHSDVVNENRTPDPAARLVRLVLRSAPWAALVAVLLVIGYFILTNHWINEIPKSVPVAAAPISEPAARPSPLATPSAPLPFPQPDNSPRLPDPERRTDWSGILWLSAGAVVLTMALLWAVRMRAAARQWTVQAWRSELAHLPGPFHGTFVMKDFVSRLPRADVEDAATVLSRAFSADWRGNELDVPRSLKQTLRSGMQPHLIFKPRRVQEPILVLQDISQSMAVHARKIDSLNTDLRKQGVVLEHWYFDGDIELPARRPFGDPVPLEQLLRQRGDGPALILSAGAGVPASMAGPDKSWLVALRRRTRLAWVNPITDSRLWPSAMLRLPVLVVPMTRAGLLHAAHALADDDYPAQRGLSRVTSAPPVTTAHIQQLRRLASVVPYPTPEFLELLRQRFAPGIPESAVLYAVDARSASSNLPFKMTDDEIREALRGIRTDNPALERQVREYLIKVLDDSEPAKGSAAHLRWQASRAIHEVQLAELRGTDAGPAIETLRQIHNGPLWEEVKAIVGRQPVSAGVVMKQLRSVVGPTGVGADAPAFASRPDGPPAETFRWVGPGWRAPVVAGIVAVFVAIGGSFLGPFQVQASHLPGAYSLAYVPPLAEGVLGQLEVRAVSEAPSEVQIYRDGEPWGSLLTLSGNAPKTVPIDEEQAHLYQVRAPLPNGALAVSNSIFAPSVVVLIDAQPWARVSVFAATSATDDPVFSGVTPATFPLALGNYRLRLESDVTGSLEPRIDVTQRGPRRFQFTMPGFTAEDLVRQLSNAGRPPAAAR